MYSKIYQINSDGSVQTETFSMHGYGVSETETGKEVISSGIKTIYDKKGKEKYKKFYSNLGRLPVSYPFAKPHSPNYAMYSNSKQVSYYFDFVEESSRAEFVKHFDFKGPEFICPEDEVIITRGFGINMLADKIVAVKEYVITNAK